jgi:sugar phosphate isomerase/epimerase
MSTATFSLSAFGDEIDDDLQVQVRLLRELGIGHLELRGVWGKNVLTFDDDEVAEVRRICDDHGVSVSCIGSPIGKSPILDPIEREAANLERIFDIAQAVGTRRVRIFSFYPPDTHTNARYDSYVKEATSRLARLTEMAEASDFLLLMENEKGIVGDTLERCHAILNDIRSPHLRFLWDPANFVQVGVARPTGTGWPLLGPFVGYIHVKDARLDDGSICAAGEGDGQVGELLAHLRDNRYHGVLALEPHLALAGHSSGFSGAGGMRHAVAALRQLMVDRGCLEETLFSL